MPPTTTTNKGANGPAIAETELIIPLEIPINELIISTG
jgi:hypothetical protein